MPTLAIVVSDIDAAVGLISSVNPILFAAYAAFKTIWMTSNPGQTEAQYIAALLALSQSAAASDAAWLVSKGYVQQPDGSWKAPAA